MSGIHLFTLLGIPVWVSPWFFLLVAIGFSGGDVGRGVLMGGVIFVSILVHEFGHALVARKYRLEPQVMLHGLGGLTAHQPAEWDHQEALIVAAGPAAGFLLALVSGAVWAWVPGVPPLAVELLGTLVFINVFWSVYNLLPIWPMDGGQLLRLAAHRLLSPRTATLLVHGLALVLVLVVGVIGAKFGFGTMLGILLFLTAWQNVSALREGGAPGTRRETEATKAQLREAELAFERGDDTEAVRLLHQLRSGARLTPGSMARLWAMLGVATTRLGKFDEAIAFLRRAPARADVVEALAQCHFQLGDLDALDGLVRSAAFRALDTDKRAVIEDALREARRS